MTQAENQLAVVDAKITNLIDEKIEACPKNFNKTRFLQNCLTVLKDLDKTKLAKVTPESIALTMVKGAFLGLDFFNRECYAIPFGDQLQFLTDYKGDIKLCRQYSIKPIKNIYAKLVREGDAFDYRIEGGLPVINFAPIPLSDAGVIGAFAVVLFDDLTLDYVTMSKKEIEVTRQNWSKCANSPAWQKAPGEMYKKTVLKRLCKMIELNFDNAEQVQAFQEGGDLKTVAIDVAPVVEDPFEAARKVQHSPGETLMEPEPAAPVSDERALLTKIRTEAENHLKATNQEPSSIYKKSIELHRKSLAELNLKEMNELRDYVVSGAI